MPGHAIIIQRPFPTTAGSRLSGCAGAPTTLLNGGTGGVQTATWQLAHGTGNTLLVTTVQVTAGGTAGGTGCAVSAQALTTD